MHSIDSSWSDNTFYFVSFHTVAEKAGGLSAGAIAGIVIACLLVVGGALGGGFYVYNKK